MHHAVGGGTCSGLGTLILERIAVNYKTKCKIGFPGYPFFKNNLKSNCVIEPYNALLTTHWMLDHNNLTIILIMTEFLMYVKINCVSHYQVIMI